MSESHRGGRGMGTSRMAGRVGGLGPNFSKVQWQSSARGMRPCRYLDVARWQSVRHRRRTGATSPTIWRTQRSACRRAADGEWDRARTIRAPFTSPMRTYTSTFDRTPRSLALRLISRSRWARSYGSRSTRDRPGRRAWEDVVAHRPLRPRRRPYGDGGSTRRWDPTARAAHCARRRAPL